MVLANEENLEAIELPEEMPILPLRGTVIFPFMIVPLVVGRKSSIKLIDDAIRGDRIIGLFAQRDPETEDPATTDIYDVGTAGMILKMLRMPDGSARIMVQGITRLAVEKFTQVTPYFKARVKRLESPADKTTKLEAFQRNALDLFQKVVELAPNLPEDAYVAAMNIEDASKLADFIASNVNVDLGERQEILEAVDVIARLERLTAILNREVDLLELGSKIQTEAKSEMDKAHREYYLRQQLRAIRKELGEDDQYAVEIDELEEKMLEKQLPDEVREEATRELSRLKTIPPQAAEYVVARTYLDWILALPWLEGSDDNLDIPHARGVLDEDHYDLADVKERILEYLSVRKLRAEMKGPILCFVGPPGVGKTSVGKSIARAVGRKFIRMSLGGVRDEAEIRGHRRTYVGALPGRVIQGIRKAGTNNPVFMLDEVDKLGMDFRGDPAAALLEVLDPEQNFSFSDHYLDLPFDLSKVMFITTANILDPIPPALRDRMEVIRLPGYTMPEKLNIAKQFLIPKQFTEHGLTKSRLRIADSALKEIVSRYTREAGVRNLERSIATICRKTARRIVEEKVKKVSVTIRNVADYLKAPPFFPETAGRRSEVGIATGMAWTAVGGVILFIEALKMPGKGELTLTGQLGDIMQESTRAAYSYIKAHARELGIDPDDFDKHNLHVHVPAGATPKDGPSAGVAMATAIASVFSGHPIRHDLAMTGEITLRGKVMPIGGVKEKLLAAVRAGIPKVLFPEENESDVLEVEDEHRSKVEVSYAKSIGDVLKAALIGFDQSETAKKAGAKPKRKARRKEVQPVAADRKR
ncbi:MAG TPA: endopeptidase La [bacterium]|nr:endopeptidase La [bacterium]